jgi:lipoyl(octanoyl) transferase
MSGTKQKIEWKISQELTDYAFAVEFMERRVKEIQENKATQMIWLVEHPPLYTAGVSARDSDLLTDKIPVYKTNRGGKHTYHGPGMRIIYVMLDLKNVFAPENPDVAEFVKMLESWIINVLAEIGIQGEIRKDRVGIWVTEENGSENKIAALGIKIKKWVSYHGIAININPDLSHFSGIVPCGISEFGVTSLEKLNQKISKEKFDELLKNQFFKIFKNYQ